MEGRRINKVYYRPKTGKPQYTKLSESWAPPQLPHHQSVAQFEQKLVPDRNSATGWSWVSEETRHRKYYDNPNVVNRHGMTSMYKSLGKPADFRYRAPINEDWMTTN